MRYTKIPTDTFKQIQLNAGIIVDSFTPATGAIGNIIGATSGGLTFNAAPTYEDFGSDIDNCPKNTKELKKLTEWAITLEGNLVTMTVDTAKLLVASADVDSQNANHIIPRNDLSQSDFKELWWIGDYSDKNGANNGGYVAIRMLNTLSTGGFQIKTSDKAKSQFAFTFTAHYSLANQSTVPFEVYVKVGTAEAGTYDMNVTSVAGSTTDYTAITASESAGSGESYVYQTGTGLYLPSEGSVLNGSGWTSWDGDDEIASTSGLDIIVAIIDSNSKAVHAGMTKVVVKES